jgi:eukaryotic-like serine/threonine-protein kinase
MTPELYQRLKPLYDAALDTPPEQRAAFVCEACGSDVELREHLDTLLAAHEERTGPVDVPLVDLKDFCPAKPRTLADGELVLGRFKIVRLLGLGGMGEVYEAEDRFLRGVNVALKTILRNVAADPDLQKRFEREVLLAHEVTHPNLCPIYTIFHCDEPPPGFLFLTMKLLPGQTLAERLREPRSMTNEEGLAVLRQASLGIAAIHAAGIIHRDIKPNNIMVDGGGPGLRLWITDFGLARAYDTSSTLSTVGKVAGTPDYIAPELFLGHPPSQASDLFALGVVLHEAFAGQKPTLVPGTHSYTVSPRLTTPKVPALSVHLITECLQDDPQRRCAAFAHTLEIVDPKLTRGYYSGQSRPFWTRRRFAAAGVCAIAGGAWWRWDDVENIVEDLLEPLPDKRYVALMPWPMSESLAVVKTILDSIGQRLARAEARANNLLIIAFKDLPGGSAWPTRPSDSVSAMGANLVLAASLQAATAQPSLMLQVLDASTERVIRKAHVSSVPSELSNMAEKASETAARLLDLPAREKSLKDTEELRRVSPEVFRIFSEAEQLVNQPNNAGLEAAVLKYQQALEIDPHFALGYARLAMAYTKQYFLGREPAKLRLAQSNAEVSTLYNPGSAKGLLSRALVLLYSDKTQEALDFFARSLRADPGNPETLLYRARALLDESQWSQAEQVYNEILKERPNYWPAYNELGFVHYHHHDYAEAATAYENAANAAPEVALPLANLGTMYEELQKRGEAVDACNRSLQRSPNKIAYRALGDIAFSDGNYKGSLDNYQRAAALDPKDHTIWRDIGDCYAMLGQTAQVRKNYAKAAQLLSDSLTANPRNGLDWATLAFYHAKIGDSARAQSDIENAYAQGAKDDVESQFFVAQALAVLGKKRDALNLVLWCLDRQLSQVEVDLALDLKDIRKDPKYLSHISRVQAQKAIKGA